jgi:hypothetical protein
MTFVGVIGILLSFVAFVWFTPRKDNSRLALFLIMAILHIASAYVYYLFVQGNDADTKLYYYDLYGFFSRGFGLSTMFVVYITQSMRELFGGSYLDYFFLYQVLGIWGLALVMRTIDETAIALNATLPPQMLALLFLPGMYFWTAAIGKDAPLFFACALAVWSSFNISGRWLWFGIAVMVMGLFRMHIALVTVVTLALAVMTGKGVPNVVRAILVIAAIVSSGFLFSTLQAELRVDISSVSSIASAVEQQTAAATRGVDDSLARSSFVIKLLSLLYRPFFIDAGSAFGLIASVQNVAMVAITILFMRNFRLWIELFRGSLPIRFATIHFVSLYLMLAIMYYNVGLGLRQREMATPSLLTVVAAVLIVSRLRRRPSAANRATSPAAGMATG